MTSAVKLADLEALLRTKHLDRTLASTQPAPLADALAAVGIPGIDAALHGGFPRGHLSELIGARSSGRTTVVHALLAAATARGEFVALVDSLDTFDPISAADAGVDLERLLWVRGPSITQSPICAPPGSLFQSACERAIKAFNLILQAGGSGIPLLVVLDLAEMPAPVLRRIPFITWLRLQRVLEGSDGVGLLLADVSLGRSARGLTLQLTTAPPTVLQTSPWQRLPFQLSPITFSSRNPGTSHLHQERRPTQSPQRD